MKAPNFYILGAAKCGTTSLYYYLGQHPDVVFSEPKEPTFFEARFKRGLDYYWSHYFSHWSGEAAVGEARVYNLYLPYVPSRIRELTPGAHLIASLRHPVDRAYSLWWHRTALGLESMSFEDAIDENRQRLAAGGTFEGEHGAREWKRGLYGDTTGTRIGTYLDGGYYADQLGRYRELFPASQLRVVFFEELTRDPQKVCAELWAFLDLPDYPEFDTATQNPARLEQRTTLARVFQQRIAPLALGRLVPAAVRGHLRRILMRGRPVQRPTLRDETRRSLIEHYRPYNRRLERLLGCDVSHWDR